ncbi:MAG: hypothetical protein E6Q34_08560 [Burkholderiaceae bacterium]|nr:MAG: hypothetical protein E6Q34_08560 [Burkholderiaceae bacterium]
MPIELSRLASEIDPTQTILFFGAGASIPSGAPSVEKLIKVLEGTLGESCDGYSLREFTGILEEKYTRKQLIEALRKPFSSLRPTGSLLNLPLYKWKAIYTTNYETLIEQCYKKHGTPLVVYESNFDFTVHGHADAVRLFKLHGSIDKDVSDGHAARLILTDNDYDQTQSFREGLYDRLRADVNGANLVIIGHSLADEHIREIANRAAEIAGKSGGISRITLLMYSRDENRATLWEKRGIRVCFGGLDDFFSAIASKLPATSPVYTASGHPFDCCPSLRPVTIDVAHAAEFESNSASMFNGWPASYADIQAGLTFNRNIVPDIVEHLEGARLCAVILGAGGLGKTTAARQVLLALRAKGFYGWEHKSDFQLQVSDWIDIARAMSSLGVKGVLFIDDAHSHLFEVSQLLDALYAERITTLKLVLTSSRNHWNPRVKSAVVYKAGREFGMGRLQPNEIDSLLNLVESNPAVRGLVGDDFSGFSRFEKRRRLTVRCESETFVCMKNIFSTEKFDDIILREYASLRPELQEIYRLVAAMESSGIRVHRQLVIRLLGIPATSIAAILDNLTDIVSEYPINVREGLYGWRGRHSVIVGILTRYKFHETAQITELFDKVIDSISPTYDIEVRTIREMCNLETGLSRIQDKETQNRLLRKMISIAPGERVPRHRLIRNMIEMGEFEKSDAEIRIYEKDFGRDAPVARYRIKLLISRAIYTSGILPEDRVAILNQAKDAALQSLSRLPNHRHLLASYCDVGIEMHRLTSGYEVYDDAMGRLKAAEIEVGDPEISKTIRYYERVMAGQPDEVQAEATPELETSLD